MDKLILKEGSSRSVDQKKGTSRKTLDLAISELRKERFRGLICAFDITGKVLYENQRVRMLFKGESIFDFIPARERREVVGMFKQVYLEGEITRNVSLPLTIGRHQIDANKISADIISFSKGLILKIPEDVLEELVEVELERLKINFYINIL